MKKIILLFILFTGLFTQCEDHDATPSPEKKSRAEKMSYGEHSYRILGYNDSGQIATIRQGLIDQGDSTETVYSVRYDHEQIATIIRDDHTEMYEFIYKESRLTETLEYTNDQITQMHFFDYDDQGRVKTWITLQGSPEAGFTPAIKRGYEYDGRGNAVKMEYYEYQRDVLDFVRRSTTTYENFDDQKNSAALFLNFYHPYHVLFQNNPATWRIKNENGSEGATHYEYVYNEEGYVTHQREVSGEMEVRFYFSED